MSVWPNAQNRKGYGRVFAPRRAFDHAREAGVRARCGWARRGKLARSMSKSPRDSEEIREWRRALDLRCVPANAVDPDELRALEASVADCKTGFEAWERLVASDALRIHWLHDEHRRFATRARVLVGFKREHVDSFRAERVTVDGGTSRLATFSPAEKPFAVRLAARAAVLDEAERLARIAVAQLRRFQSGGSRAQPEPRVLWVHGTPAMRSHDTTRAARSMQTRLALVFSAAAIPAMADPTQARALVNRMRALDWQFARGVRALHCAMHRERWQLLLDAFAPYASVDGAIEARVDLTGLDGTRVLRIEPHERENPFVALAALEALGVTLSGSGTEWIELSIPGFSGV